MNSGLEKLSNTLKELKEAKRRDEKREKLAAKIAEGSKHIVPAFNLTNEKRRLFSKEIFDWRDEFMQTKEFRGIFYIRELLGQIDIFHGGYGHDGKDFDEFGQHSRIILRKNGILKYSSGYKWMPGDSFELDKKISRLTDKYLTDFHSHIMGGAVYDTIKRELESGPKI